MSQEGRNISSNNNRPRAVKALTMIDFSRYTGSDFNVQITKLDGTELCPEFCIDGEDMIEIAPSIVKSLRQSLKFKRVLLLSNLNEVNEAIGGSDEVIDEENDAENDEENAEENDEEDDESEPESEQDINEKSRAAMKVLVDSFFEAYYDEANPHDFDISDHQFLSAKRRKFLEAIKAAKDLALS